MTEVGAFDATGYRQRVLSRLRGAARARPVRSVLHRRPARRRRRHGPDPGAHLARWSDSGTRSAARTTRRCPPSSPGIAVTWRRSCSTRPSARTAPPRSGPPGPPPTRTGTARSTRSPRSWSPATRGCRDPGCRRSPGSRRPGASMTPRSPRGPARQHVIEDGADAEPLAGRRARPDPQRPRRVRQADRRLEPVGDAVDVPRHRADDVRRGDRGRHAELSGENERRQHDHQMTIVANLLTYVKQHLMTGDAARYAASLIEDAKDRLRDTVAEKVIVDGELNAADYEACVRRVIGFGFGLSSEQARLAVTAGRHRSGRDAGGRPCRRLPAVPELPGAAASQPASRPAGTAAPTCTCSCPACGQQAEAAAVACPHCGDQLPRDPGGRRAGGRGTCRTRARAVRRPPALSSARPPPRRRNAPALASQIASLSAEVDRVIATAESRLARRRAGPQRPPAVRGRGPAGQDRQGRRRRAGPVRRIGRRPARRARRTEGVRAGRHRGRAQAA